MPLNIPIREQGPPLRVRVFPPLIPRGLRELGACPVDCFQRGSVTDTVVVWSDAHNRSVLLVQTDVVVFEMPVP